MSGDRERVGLAGLAVFRQLRAKQLERLMFDGRPVSPRSRVVITSRVLRRLRSRRLIAADALASYGERGGGGERTYRLTERGCRYLAELDPAFCDLRRPPRDSASTDHACMAADVYLALASAARLAGHAVSDWHPDWRAAELLGSSQLIPDGHVLYRSPSWELDACVEIDTGSERPSQFAAKVAEYVAVLRSGTWRARLASWPLVLVVASTAPRASALKLKTEEVLRSARDALRLLEVAPFYFASISDARDGDGPLSAIWEVSGRTGRHGLLPPDPAEAEPPKPQPERGVRPSADADT